MSKQIFVNLPVKDLKRTVDFFTQLGFSFNPQFTDENATSMVVSENIYIMLLVEKFFKTFTPKAISDASQGTEVIVTLSMDSRAAVDELVDKAMQLGARRSSELQEYEWMYARSFEDLDGHLWEFVYMDWEKMPAAPVSEQENAG